MNFFCLGLVLLFSASSIDGQVQVQFLQPATQTSSWRNIYTANRAIDGNTGRQFFRDTCSHTDCFDNLPSWTVQFSQAYTIQTITIYTPFEAHGRTKNLRVDVYQDNPTQFGAVAQPCFTVNNFGLPNGAIINRQCPPGVTGRYLRISKTIVDPNVRCDSILLCEVQLIGTAVAGPVPPVPPAVNCVAGMFQNGNICYFFSRPGIRGSWAEAQEYCVAMNAYLAVITSNAEQNFINNQLGAGAGNYWIGGSDMLQEGTFRWMSRDTNQVIGYTNWANPAGGNQQPDNGDPANNEHCILLGGANAYRWSDADCTVTRRFICQRNLAV